MSDLGQIRDDLAFVSDAVRRRESRPDMFWVYLAWAVYVLVGYTMLDHWRSAANIFLTVGWVPAALIAAWAAKRMKARGDTYDRETRRRIALHWGGGIVLAVGATMGLAAIVPALRGPLVGQIIVIIIGIVYYLAGVHFDRRFLVLGPAMVVCGLLLQFMPVWPWTCLGVVIAAGLLIPSFFKRGPHVAQTR